MVRRDKCRRKMNMVKNEAISEDNIMDGIWFPGEEVKERVCKYALSRCMSLRTHPRIVLKRMLDELEQTADLRIEVRKK